MSHPDEPESGTEGAIGSRERVAYTRGRRGIAKMVISGCLVELGYSRSDGEFMSLVTAAVEREGTIAALREACTNGGDNDWDEHLHLVL